MGGPPLDRRDLVSSAWSDMGVAMTIAHRATEMRGGDEACGADDEEASRVRTPYRTRPSRPSPWLRWPSRWWRSEEHTSELQSLMRISYAVFGLKKKKNNIYDDNMN